MPNNTPNPTGIPDDPKHLRLTLRTLLAYLDDVLEPAQAREIGAKIQETQYASQLVDRIQEVLRRRRVAAPDLKGPGAGLDPNTVAEYLDNTLAAKAVPDVERVCLESDMHLAEVAASHQILTLVLGEPLHVSAESRERMYALIPHALASKSPEHHLEPAGAGPRSPSHRHAESAQVAASAVSAPGEAVQPSSNGGGASAPAPARFSETIPEYLKPKPVWKRALVPAIVVLIFLGWLGLIVFDSSFWGTSGTDSESQKVAQTDQKKTAKTANSPAPAKTEPKAKESPAPKENAASNKVAENPAAPAKPIPIDEPAPKDMDEDKVLAKTDTTKPLPGNTEKVVPKPVEPPVPANPPNVAPAKPGQTTKPPEEAPANPMPIPQGPRVQYTTKAANSAAKSGMLLRYDEANQEWGTLPPRALVMLGEPLACPEPLDAVFHVGDTDCEVTFVGGVLASFRVGKDPAAFALKLDQGKVIFTRTGAKPDSVTLNVIVGSDILQLELLEPNSRCGLDIQPKFPSQFEKSLGADWYNGRLWVQTGEVRFRDRAKQSHQLAARQALDITPREAAANPQVVEADVILPEWLNPAGRDFLKLHAQYVRQLYAAFADADVESDVTMVLLPLAKDERTPPPVAVMAAKTLAMTGCLRDVAELMSLSAATPMELREATIDGVRHWLTLHPDKKDGERLRNQLRRNFQQDTADVIYRLLWGYRKSDLQDRNAALALVDWLDDDNITVRTLAFKILTGLTGRTNSYRPLDTASQRRVSIQRWRNDVNEGKLFN